MIERYKIELWLWWESYILDNLVEVVKVAILFKIHFTRMVGSLCHVAQTKQCKKWERWYSYSDVAKSLSLLECDTVWAVPDALRDYHAFIFSIMKSQKAQWSFEIFESAHQVAQRHIPNETNPQYKEHINKCTLKGLKHERKYNNNITLRRVWNFASWTPHRCWYFASTLVALSIPVHILLNTVTTVPTTTTTTTTTTTSVWDSAIGIATCYGLGGLGIKSR